MKIPTIKDIAAAVGVNHCVVSHVLHNDAYAAKVRPETRQRILELARKMGYRRNSMASAIRTGQVNTIAVILNFNDLQNSSMNQIMSGIMVETAERKYSVKVFSDSDLVNAFQIIVENRIDKVISMSVDREHREKTAELAEKYAINLVYAYEHGHSSFPAVNVDNAEMTSRAVHYLVERGHSRIGLLCSPHNRYFKIERHDGYLKGMKDCGLTTDSRWIACSENNDEVVDSMLSLPAGQRPTAFISVSDSDAVRALHLAWKRGLRIPEEFSIIGIGDAESSRLAMLPITTFRESLQDTGKLLIRMILGDKPDFPPDEFNVYRTHAEMIERNSVCDRANRKIQDSRCKSQVPGSESRIKGNKNKKTTGKDM